MLAFTVSTKGTVLTCEIGSKSLTGSYGSLAKKDGLTGWPLAVSNRVYPSGACLAPYSGALLPPAPGRLSTLTGCPGTESRRSALTRAGSVASCDLRRQTIPARQRMEPGPAVLDDLRDDLRRQRHVQAAVPRGMEMGELALDHERAVSRMPAPRQMKRARARNRNQARADHHARERAPGFEDAFLQIGRRVLIELRVRVRRRR